MSEIAVKVLDLAAQRMAGKKRGNWNDYEHFKGMVQGYWLSDYDAFISALLKILKL